MDMNFSQGSLFDALGIDFDEMAAGTKKKAEKKQEKKTKTQSSKSKRKKSLIKLPVSVYTGYMEAVSVDMMSVGKTEITEDELKKEVAKLFSSIPADKIVLAGKDGTYYAAVDAKVTLAKGEIKANAETKLYLPNGQEGPSLSTVMTDKECMVTLPDIDGLVNDIPGLKSGVALISVGSNHVMIPGGDDLEESEELAFPITIEVFGRASVEVTKEGYESFVKEKGNQGDCKYDYKMLVSYFVAQYPEFKEHLLLEKVKDNPHLLMARFEVRDTKPQKQSAQKKYPTDVTVSFAGVNRVELSADMFDGKAEITEDELIEWCHSLYPEFKKGRVMINYYKDEKLIIPLIKGSTKGAFGLRTVESAAEFNAAQSKGLPFLYYHKEKAHTFRVESTKVSLTMAAMDTAYQSAGVFQYRLPKMSGKLWQFMDHFFRHITEEYGTEIMFRIFWNNVKSEYELELPAQTVTGASVMEDSEDKDGILRRPDCIAVAEFHSHGFYNAFFSAVDNEDELGNKIYGVMGDYGTSESKSIMRAGTGGKYVMIDKSAVFTDEVASDKEIADFIEHWINEAEKVVSFE